VVDELGDQIDVTRSEGAQGVSFFREAFSRSEDFDRRFERLSLQPPVALRFEAQAPDSVESLSVTVDGPRQIHVEWLPPAASQADPLGWYAIYRRSRFEPDENNPRDLAAVLFRDRISYDDVLPEGETGPVFYSVVAISRLGFLSDPTDPVSTGQLPVGVEEEVPTASFRLDGIYPNPASDRISIDFIADAGRTVELRIVDELGRGVARRTVQAAAGKNTLTLPTEQLPSGLYVAQIVSGSERAHGTFVILR
jgi:hypothetical protein